MKNLSFRNEIYKYVSEKYNTKPEYLWFKYPSFAVFRNSKNNKWFGIIMNVPYAKFGIKNNQITDVINVKVDDILLRELLVNQHGFFKGYHMSNNWVSILLDGTVELQQIFNLIDSSYLSIANKK